MTIARKLHVTHIASGDLWAGAEVQLYTLCKALSKLNKVSVSVILLNHGTLEQKLKECKIPVTVLDETKLNSLQIGWLIFKQLRQQRPDIVHTHRLKENILGSMAAKMVQIPSLRTVHGAPEHAPSWLRPHKRLFYVLDWLIGRFLQSSIIAVSDELKALLNKKFPQNKVIVIPNGVDTEALTPFAKPDNWLETRSGPYKIGLVGRLVPVKRVDIFIRTARYLQDYHPEIDARFHIYGEGPLRQELEDLRNELGLEERVYFEGHTADIHKQIASLDILMITSEHEGLPMTLLESIMIGTPIIANAVGGIPHVCGHGKYCWLIENNTSERDIAEILKYCLNNAKSSSDKARQGQKNILYTNTANHNAMSVSKLYESTANWT